MRVRAAVAEEGLIATEPPVDTEARLPQARGRGGGRALVEAVLQHAATHDAHKVELEVWPDNAPAIALYESVGFVAEGVLRDHYRRRDGSLRSALIMARSLDAGPRRPS